MISGSEESIIEYMTGKETKIPYFDRLDLNHTTFNTNEEYNKVLLRKLKRLGLFAPTLLFTGIHNVPLDTVRTLGTDSPTRDTTFAFTLKRLKDYNISSLWEYADYGGRGDPSLILVYDGIKLEETDEGIPPKYIFKKGIRPLDALIAGLQIRWPS